MNGKMTITKEKYLELCEKAKRFEFIQKLAFDTDSLFQKPASRNVSTVIKEMKKTQKYNESFLKSIQNGLKKSSYFSR